MTENESDDSIDVSIGIMLFIAVTLMLITLPIVGFFSSPQLIITDEIPLEEYDGEYSPIEEIGGEQKTIVYETVRKNGTTTSLDYSGTYLIDDTVYEMKIQYSNTIYFGILHILIGILSMVWVIVRNISK